MSLKNEKTKRQNSTSATRKEAGSQALKAQKDCPYQEIAGEAASSSATQQTTPEATDNRCRKEGGSVESVQDVVGKFLQKGETTAAEYIELIEEMLGDYRGFHWAESTLIGIYDFIEKNGYITTKQMEAVDNIRKSKYER